MPLSRSDPRRLAAIYAGGVIGALARVGLAEAAPHGAASWPWATFAANRAGALLLGCFVAFLRGHREESPGFALLTTGICGTLTTFATFQLELFEMLDAGAVGLAIGYAVASIAGGLLFLSTGLRLGRHDGFQPPTVEESPQGEERVLSGGNR
jgi:CrcB protein